jgi:hypothetical protein
LLSDTTAAHVSDQGPDSGIGSQLTSFVELQQSSYLRLLALGRLQGAQPLN